MKLKLKYSEKMMYFCHLCSAPFSVAVHQHFSESHNMHNPVENMNFVQIVSLNGGKNASIKAIFPNAKTAHSPSSSASSTSPTSCDLSPCQTSSPTKHTTRQSIQTSPTASNSTAETVLLKMEEMVNNTGK